MDLAAQKRVKVGDTVTLNALAPSWCEGKAFYIKVVHGWGVECEWESSTGEVAPLRAPWDWIDQKAAVLSQPANEIGEELFAHELVATTVYVLQGAHRPGQAMTLWYMGVKLGYAIFSGEQTGLLLRIGTDGKLFDSVNHQIKVHKYLGKV